MKLYRYLFLLLFFPAVFSCEKINHDGEENKVAEEEQFTGTKQSGITYQLLVYTFADSDGDGVGDFNGIAEHLDYPQVTYAVEARVEGGEVLVKRETGDGFEVLAASMPCVVTVTKPYFDPRFPTIKSKLAAGRAQIPTLTADDLPVDRESIGLKGSPTKVKKSFTPPQKQGGIKISEDSSEASARKLFAMLSDANIIG